MTILTQKIDFCPAGELAGKLGIPEGQLLIPEAKAFAGEESAQAFYETTAPFNSQNLFVGLVVLEPKVSAAAMKVIEKLRGSLAELAERLTSPPRERRGFTVALTRPPSCFVARLTPWLHRLTPTVRRWFLSRGYSSRHCCPHSRYGRT